MSVDGIIDGETHRLFLRDREAKWLELVLQPPQATTSTIHAHSLEIFSDDWHASKQCMVGTMVQGCVELEGCCLTIRMILTLVFT